MEKVKTIFYICGGMETQDANVSKDEKIGFHKGALDSLLKERSELARLLSIVEQLITMHAKALKDMGIDLGQKQESKTGGLETKANEPDNRANSPDQL